MLICSLYSLRQIHDLQEEDESDDWKEAPYMYVSSSEVREGGKEDYLYTYGDRRFLAAKFAREYKRNMSVLEDFMEEEQIEKADSTKEVKQTEEK